MIEAETILNIMPKTDPKTDHRNPIILHFRFVEAKADQVKLSGKELRSK